MRKLYQICFLLLLLGSIPSLQAQKVILVNSAGRLFELDLASGNCNTKEITGACTINNPSTGFSVALFKDTLYYNTGNGTLYRTVLNNPASCKALGVVTGSNALTVDKNGLLYWVDGGGLLVTYNPNTNQLRNIGFSPYVPAGDLIFFGDKLIMAAQPKGLIGYSLVEVDTNNPAQSKVIMETPGYAFFGLINVPAGCNQNKIYGIAANLVGPGSELVEIDIVNKSIVGKVCTVLENVYDAASITESGNVQGVNINNLIQRPACGFNGTGSISVNGVSATPGVSVSYALNNGTPNTSGLFTNLAPGNYALKVTSSDGCSKDTIAIIPQIPRARLNLQISADTCGTKKGSVLLTQLTNNGTLTYVLNNTTISTNNRFTALSAGTYQLKTTDTNNCEMDTSFVVTNFQPPLPLDALTTKAADCAQPNGQLTLVFSNNASIQGVRIDGGNLQTGTTVFSNLAAGNHQLQIQTSTCIFDTGFTIPQKLSVAPIIAYTNTAPDCYNRSNGSTRIQVTGNAAPYTIRFNNGAYTSNEVYTGLTSATYPVSVKDAAGCEFNGSVTIPAFQAKPVTIQSTVTDVDCWQSGGGKASITVSGPEAPYFFAINGQSGLSGQTISGLPTGNYQVLIRNGNNCAIDSTNITIREVVTPGVVCDTVYVPSAFTPNADGRNDVLRPVVNNLTNSFIFKVYNRYGQVVFESTAAGKGWNGRWKGVEQPVGTYVWVVTYTTGTRKRTFKGTTVLLR